MAEGAWKIRSLLGGVLDKLSVSASGVAATFGLASRTCGVKLVAQRVSGFCGVVRDFYEHGGSAVAGKLTTLLEGSFPPASRAAGASSLRPKEVRGERVGGTSAGELRSEAEKSAALTALAARGAGLRPPLSTMGRGRGGPFGARGFDAGASDGASAADADGRCGGAGRGACAGGSAFGGGGGACSFGGAGAGAGGGGGGGGDGGSGGFDDTEFSALGVEEPGVASGGLVNSFGRGDGRGMVLHHHVHAGAEVAEAFDSFSTTWTEALRKLAASPQRRQQLASLMHARQQVLTSPSTLTEQFFFDLGEVVSRDIVFARVLFAPESARVPKNAY